MTRENENELDSNIWRQVGGDMSPGAHGGLIARMDESGAVEIREIQPTREYVGDSEAADVGFPFWSREGCFDAADRDLSRADVQTALRACGIDAADLPEDADDRAFAIAECLLRYGCGDEGPAGWAADVCPMDVLWAGTRALQSGTEYLADDESEFRTMLCERAMPARARLAAAIVEYRAELLEIGETEGDLRVRVYDGGYEILTGDPGYDTDHRGWIAATTVSTTEDCDGWDEAEALQEALLEEASLAAAD